MTPILKARYEDLSAWPRVIVAEDGTRFQFGYNNASYMQGLNIGDEVWVSRRNNVPKDHPEAFDLYKVKLEVWVLNGKPMKSYAKTWFGKGRQVMVRVR